ncbi:WD40-repeat-containing domain protein [Baffinella frigidus]|nr:WD40-repeat-containing domain protein [Cryptophyta sp. CCMP2293]
MWWLFSSSCLREDVMMRFTLSEFPVTCLDAAGATIVSGSDDRSARFWNATTGTLLRTFGVHDGPLADVRIHGSLVATGSFDGRVRVFDCVSGRCLRVMSGHRNAVMCLAARARVLVSGSNDRDLRVFQLPDPSEPDTLPLLDAGQGATPLRAGLTSATDSPKTWRRGRETPAGGANLSSFSGGNPPPSAGGTASHDSLASSGFSAAVATSLGNLAGSSSSVPLGGGEDAEGGEGGGQGGEGGQSLQRLPLPQTGFALKGHHSGVRAVALAGERLLLSVSDDYELRVWDFSAVPSGGSRS